MVNFADKEYFKKSLYYRFLYTSLKEAYDTTKMTASYALRKFYETIMSAEGSRERYCASSPAYSSCNNFEERTHFI